MKCSKLVFSIVMFVGHATAHSDHANHSGNQTTQVSQNGFAALIGNYPPEALAVGVIEVVAGLGLAYWAFSHYYKN